GGEGRGLAESPETGNAAGSPPPMPTPPVELPAEVHAPALAADALPDSGMIAPQPSLALLDGLGEVRTLEEIESEAIRFAITHYRGQMSQVARRLQIGRSTLYRKLDSLGLATTESAGSDSPEGVVGG